MLRRLGRTEFVRADIRNPLIGKVIASASVDTVVHMNISSTPGRLRRARADEGTQRHRHDAAAGRVPAGAQRAAVRAEVDERPSTGPPRATPPCSPRRCRPGAVPSGGFAKDSLDIEGYVRAFARRRPDVGVAVAAVHQLHRSPDRLGAHQLLPHAGGAHRARLRRPGAAPARGRRPGGAHPRDHRRLRRHGERGRRGHPAALAGHPPAGARRAADPDAGAGVGRPALAPFRVRRLLARADALPQLRPCRGHDRAARRVRLHPPLHDGGRLGRLRPHGVPRGVAPPGGVGGLRRPLACSSGPERPHRRSAGGCGPRPRLPGCGRCAMPEARVIPLRPDDDEPYRPARRHARLGGPVRRGAGLPAPPAERRVRDRRVRLRPRPRRPRAAADPAAVLPEVVPRRDAGSGERARPPAAPSWWPTTRARSRWTP